jgi:hypothetical protein
MALGNLSTIEGSEAILDRIRTLVYLCAYLPCSGESL